jgi:hypothetical protein
MTCQPKMASKILGNLILTCSSHFHDASGENFVVLETSGRSVSMFPANDIVPDRPEKLFESK